MLYYSLHVYIPLSKAHVLYVHVIFLGLGSGLLTLMLASHIIWLGYNGGGFISWAVGSPIDVLKSVTNCVDKKNNSTHYCEV